MPRRDDADGNPPDDQDPDDDDEDNDKDDDDFPNDDGHWGSGGRARQRSSVERTSYKPGAKLPTLYPKQFYWDGEKARLRIYIQRWYDHLKTFQDYAALMFLQRCVPPNYQDIVLSH